MKNIFKKKIYVPVISFILITIILIEFGTAIKTEYRNIKFITDRNSIFDLRFADGNYKEITFKSDSLTISADLYETENEKPPCILLLHGNYSEGNKKPLILTLAEEFNKSGYEVLAINFRGFAESEGFIVDSISDLNFAQDIKAAINFLTDSTNVDTSKIYIIGHSFGAGAALKMLEAKSKIAKMVLFGPPRRLNERLSDDSDKVSMFSKSLSQTKIGITDINIWVNSRQILNIENYIDELKKTDHIPIFLIDSEKEDKRDIQFLRNILTKISEPVDYWTIPNENHYLNTRYFFNKPAYNIKLVEQFVGRVDKWLKN